MLFNEFFERYLDKIIDFVYIKSFRKYKRSLLDFLGVAIELKHFLDGCKSKIWNWKYIRRQADWHIHYMSTAFNDYLQSVKAIAQELNLILSDEMILRISRLSNMEEYILIAQSYFNILIENLRTANMDYTTKYLLGKHGLHELFTMLDAVFSINNIIFNMIEAKFKAKLITEIKNYLKTYGPVVSDEQLRKWLDWKSTYVFDLSAILSPIVSTKYSTALRPVTGQMLDKRQISDNDTFFDIYFVALRGSSPSFFILVPESKTPKEIIEASEYKETIKEYLAKQIDDIALHVISEASEQLDDCIYLITDDKLKKVVSSTAQKIPIDEEKLYRRALFLLEHSEWFCRYIYLDEPIPLDQSIF